MGGMTIREVAETAGVSVSTVSLALRGDPRVAPGTREVVAKTAARLKYRRRAPGRPPRKDDEPPVPRRTNRIALLVPGMPRAVLNAPVYMDVLHGVEAAVTEQRKVFVLRHLLPDMPAPAMLLPQKVDGLVLFGQPGDVALIEQLQSVPCVQMMGVPQHDLPWDHVTYDNGAIGELAGEYLLRRGHRVLAMLAQPPQRRDKRSTDTTFGRYAGLRRALESRPDTTLHTVWDEPLVRLTPTHQEAVRETLERIVDRLLTIEPRPTGFFCPYDHLTAALHPALLARGLAPGRDIDLVSCNNEVILLQNLHPRPATVDIHAHDVGRRAVEQLLWRLDHPQAPRSVITLAPTLVEGSVR